MRRAVMNGERFEDIPEIAKHAEWFEKFRDDHLFTVENVENIIKTEIGKTFVRVLRDAGVYKDTDKGRCEFLRFLSSIGGREVK